MTIFLKRGFVLKSESYLKICLKNLFKGIRKIKIKMHSPISCIKYYNKLVTNDIFNNFQKYSNI
jgi:hypothetical protein